jgi:putative oxidoreductase
MMKSIIKSILNPGYYPNNISLALLFLRICVGVFMLTHGIGKFLMLIGDDPIKFANPIGVGFTASLVLAVFAEVFCSVFLIMGFAPRITAIPLLITMLVATLIVHSDDPFSKKELPLLYSSIYVVIAIAGAGKYSIDNWISMKLNEKS